MILLNIDFSLPLGNPVIIFTIVLFIILFAPILFSKIKVPHIIGLILAGTIIGPHGLNLLRRDSSIVLFGTVGLLYIMFLAGLEIDLSEFKKNRNKIIFFGLTTFVLPLTVGIIACYYVLGYGFLSSLLLAAMFSTHTLVSYPIASQYGLSSKQAVTLTVGGTMITDILALLILAGVAGITKDEVSGAFWLQLGFSSIIFVCVVFFLFPVVIRWFFKKYEDSVSQYVFVLATVFLASFLAEAAGLEAIIGAFFAGLVLNSFVPHSSPLMNRINFVGNALFIPFFLLGVGMLVDVSIIVRGWGALKVAGTITLVAILTKYIAAKLTQRAFKLSKTEGNLIFGLSTSHAAATLAIILVGYNIIIGEAPTGEPIRLLNEDVLNGTILLILVSCAVSSFVVESASSKLALEAADTPQQAAKAEDRKILLSLAYPESIASMVDLGLMFKPKKSNSDIFALHVVNEEDPNGANHELGKKLLDKAVNHASATDNTIIPLTRFDASASNGIVYTIKEYNITDVIIGLHQNAARTDFLGLKAENILKRVRETVHIYKPHQPINTIKRMLVVVPPRAELEPGFLHWLSNIVTLAQQSGFATTFYGAQSTLTQIQVAGQRLYPQLTMMYEKFTDWDDFLIFSREIKKNDLFVIISSRKDNISYLRQLNKLPHYLITYFEQNSFLIIYPKQLESGSNIPDIEAAEENVIGRISGRFGAISRIKQVFKGKSIKKERRQ
jgi:Kef-type K+ transport system membrane component KefB